MKINKYFLGLAVAIMGGLTSCNTDVEGEYYSTSQDNVSFEISSTSLSVPVDQSTVTIPVSVTRGNVASAYSAKYVATASADGIFSDDANGVINFEAGQGTAVINVTAANLEKEVPYTYTLTLSDEDVATADTITNTQISSFTLSVEREGDWTEWKTWNSAGTANYVYGGYFFSGEDPGLNFLYRQNINTPTTQQLKLEHWGYDVDLILNYDASTGEVYLPETFTGYVHSTYGNIYVTDYTNYDTASQLKGTFDTTKGIVTLVVYYFDADGGWGAGYEYIYLDGFVRADYSISGLTYAGIFTDINSQVFAVANLELAADANNVKAIVVEGGADADAVADAIAAGEVEATDVVAGQINVPIAEGLTGELRMVVVSLDADGAVASTASAEFEYYGGGVNPWTKLGVGYLTDNFVITRFYKDQSTGEVWTAQTYEVEMEQNSETGVIRVADAFRGAVVNLVGESRVDDYYESSSLDINAADPDGVYFQATPVGFNGMSVASYGGYWLSRGGEGNDFASLKADGYLGTLKNGVITLPQFNYRGADGQPTGDIFQGIVVTSNGASYGGWVDDGVEFKVVLPSASAAAKKKAASMARAAAFERNLYGLEMIKGIDVKMASRKSINKMMNVNTKTTRVGKGFTL